MIPSLPFAAALAIATVSATLAQAGATRPASTSATSMLGRPRYDANEQGLRVPFAGTVPIYTRGSLKAPPRIFLDFDAPTRIATVVSEGVPNHPVWLSWAMAARDKGKTRLTMVFRRDTSISVRVDRDRGYLMIVPRIPAPDEALRPVTGPTPIDESLPALPEATPAPRRTAAPLPTPAMPRPTMTPWIPTPRDGLVPTDGRDAGSRPVSPRPTMTPWIPTPRDGLVPADGRDAGSRPASPRPTMTPWIPVRTPAPLPAPSALPTDLGLIYLPGSPEPAETPTITISTPSPAPLAPVPTPPPAMRGSGGTDVLAQTSAAYGFYDEVPVGSTMAARSDSQRILGTRLLTRLWPGGRMPVVADGWLPWWSLGLDLYGGNVAYTDPAVTSALHARQEWRSHLSFARGIRLSPLELQGGVGVMGRYETNWLAGTAAGTVATGWRAIVAPELVLLGRLPLFGGLELYGEGAMAPFALTWVPASAAAAPSLSGTRFETGLAGTWSGLRFGAGYRRWSMTGAGYGETFQGPVVTLGGWLDPQPIAP